MKLVLIAVAILLMISGSQGFAFSDSLPLVENGTIIISEYDHLSDMMNQENGSVVLSIQIGDFK
jgi:hypothetical protein